MKSAPLFLMAALALGACRSSEEPKKETAEKPAAEAREKKKPRVREPVDEGIDVPTEEDFEEEIATQITEQSDLGKELDTLEKEIGK